MRALPDDTAGPPRGRTEGSPRDTAIGVAAALVVVTVWATWIVGTRFAATADIPLSWLALFRFGIPALVLAPVWLRSGPLPLGVPRKLIFLIVACAGAPFFALVAFGLSIAPAAEAGVLLPGTMGLWAALLAKLVFKERFGPDRTVGLALSVAGVVLIAMPTLAGGHLMEGAGRLLLPFGAFLWATYTLAYRETGLPPMVGAGVICFWSTLMVIPFVVATGVEPLLSQPTGQVLVQVVIQGLLSGLVSLIGYGIAVSRLGASRAAAFSSLAPAMAALLAIPALGEIPPAIVVAGVAVTVAGVALSSGALRSVIARGRARGRTPPDPA
ncbi:DMT family transporter [Amorphus sp. MBR-141]